MINPMVCLRVAAMFGGGTLIASQVIQNLEHLGKAEAYSGLGLAAITVPIAMAITVPVMEYYWKSGARLAAFVALIVLLCGLSHTAFIALKRGVVVQDAANSNHAYNLSKESLDSVRERIGDIRKGMKTEAKTGIGDRYKALVKDLEAEQVKEAELLDKLGEMKPPVDTASIGTRYGTVATVFETWHPLFLPFAMEVGALLLIGFALRSAGTTSRLPTKLTKLEEAKIVIRKLVSDEGRTLTLDEIVARSDITRSTAHRALQEL